MCENRTMVWELWGHIAQKTETGTGTSEYSMDVFGIIDLVPSYFYFWLPTFSLTHPIMNIELFIILKIENSQ